MPYLNYHRPCHFAEIKINEKGKVIKKYPLTDLQAAQQLRQAQKDLFQKIFKQKRNLLITYEQADG